MRILIDVPLEETRFAALQAMPGIHVDTVEPSEQSRPLPEHLLQEAEALFCAVPPSNFSECGRLRWIQISSAGYSQLFGLDLPGRRIRATNARGCFDVPIAEWNIAMMVNLARDLRQMIRNQDAGVWDRGARFQSEIRGKTVGLWGYGGIGRETARLAKLMGMRIHVLSRSGFGATSNVYAVPGTGDPEGTLPDHVFTAGQETDFLASLDFLILAMPLTPSTEGIVGERELQALPSSAYLLNPARGPLVQQDALLRALWENGIAGAAIDTHYEYPLPPQHPLWSFPNVILTPHISGSSLNPHFRERIWDIFLENVQRIQNQESLLNELSPEQLQGA